MPFWFSEILAGVADFFENLSWPDIFSPLDETSDEEEPKVSEDPIVQPETEPEEESKVRTIPSENLMTENNIKTVEEIKKIAEETGREFSKVFWEVKKEEGWTMPIGSDAEFDDPHKYIDYNGDGQFDEEEKNERGIYFGASRGSRTHAGIDIGVEVGESILAMTGGTILRNEYDFVAGTNVIDVLNDDGTIIRYGEVESLINEITGEKYGEGDRIEQGKAFSSVMLNDKGRGMLHIEVYSFEIYEKFISKNKDGKFSFKDRNNEHFYYVENKSYQRHSDLIDATDLLNLPYYNEN